MIKLFNPFREEQVERIIALVIYRGHALRHPERAFIYFFKLIETHLCVLQCTCTPLQTIISAMNAFLNQY